MSANLGLLHKLQELDEEHKYVSEWTEAEKQEVHRLANRRTERQELADSIYSLAMHGWTIGSIAVKLGKTGPTVSQLRNETVRKRGLHYVATADELEQLEYIRIHWDAGRHKLTQTGIARMMGRTTGWVREMMRRKVKAND